MYVVERISVCAGNDVSMAFKSVQKLAFENVVDALEYISNEIAEYQENKYRSEYIALVITLLDLESDTERIVWESPNWDILNMRFCDLGY